MQFVAEHYFQASLERIENARILYAADLFGYSIYTSGLAAECLLRAFHWLKHPVFDARHDIGRLFKSSGFAEIETTRLERRASPADSVLKVVSELFAARDTIVRYWSNDYRFIPESQLRARLRALRAPQSKRGNQVKPCALAVYNAAKLLIDTGSLLWTFVKK